MTRQRIAVAMIVVGWVAPMWILQRIGQCPDYCPEGAQACPAFLCIGPSGLARAVAAGIISSILTLPIVWWLRRSKQAHSNPSAAASNNSAAD